MAKQQEEEVILLNYWASMFGMRVRIALAEKGVSYEYKEQDLINKSQLLLETNPVHKKVPVLIHNGNPVCESSIIVEYIDEVWNDKAPLFPDDAYAKAHAKFWADFIDKKLYQSGRNLYTKKGDEHEVSRKEFIDCLKLLEGELGDKTYFGDDMFSYIDLSLIPFHSWFQVYEIYGNLNLENECPKLIAWAKICVENKESVSNTLPDMSKVFGLAQSRRKRFGLEE
nr:probable glutathione S-transferase [Tanacetum cinerariifolium]